MGMRGTMAAKEIAEIREYAAEVSSFRGHRIAAKLLSEMDVLRAENEALKRKWDNLDSHTQVVINHQNKAIADLTRERDEARASWLCFHCGFTTADKAKAEAHFGEDSGDPVLCLYWAKMTPEERGQELQDTVQQLNAERDHSGQLTMELEVVERQNAAMRGTLEHIGKSELMGIQYARRIALFALQPAPEPAAPNS